LGASTVSLPGSDIFPGLEKGTIDAADYVGPAVNWDLGFAQVAKYILFGPPESMSMYQAVDLMDLTVNLGAWKRLSPELQTLFVKAGTRLLLRPLHRHPEGQLSRRWRNSRKPAVSQPSVPEDAIAWRKMIIPIWFNWAKKDIRCGPGSSNCSSTT
jgi:TRAP-type C4-dicarboxylate transport system substrate-binding protein